MLFWGVGRSARSACRCRRAGCRCRPLTLTGQSCHGRLLFLSAAHQSYFSLYGSPLHPLSSHAHVSEHRPPNRYGCPHFPRVLASHRCGLRLAPDLALARPSSSIAATGSQASAPPPPSAARGAVASGASSAVGGRGGAVSDSPPQAVTPSNTTPTLSKRTIIDSLSVDVDGPNWRAETLFKGRTNASRRGTPPRSRSPDVRDPERT